MTIPFVGLAVLQAVRDELPKQNQDDIPPILGLLSWEGWLAVGLGVLLLVVVEGAYRASAHEAPKQAPASERISASPGQQLEEKVRAFLREGNQILDAIANINQPIPKALAENWFQRGRHFLEDNLSELYVTDWNNKRVPQQGFTGMITSDRKPMWNSVKARVELLEAIDDELRGS